VCLSWKTHLRGAYAEEPGNGELLNVTSGRSRLGERGEGGGGALHTGRVMFSSGGDSVDDLRMLIDSSGSPSSAAMLCSSLQLPV